MRCQRVNSLMSPSLASSLTAFLSMFESSSPIDESMYLCARAMHMRMAVCMHARGACSSDESMYPKTSAPTRSEPRAYHRSALLAGVMSPYPTCADMVGRVRTGPCA